MIPGSNPVLSFRPPQADSGGQTRTPQVFMIELADKIKIIDAPITADEEAALLDQGSEQKNLWGINIYVGQPQDSRLEFDSMINIRPSQNNRSRAVEDAPLQKKIIDVVNGLIK